MGSEARGRQARSIAALVLRDVFRSQMKLDAALDRRIGQLSDLDRSLVREICFGSCRRFHELDAALRQLLDRPLRARDADLQALLLTGMYQIRYMRVPVHAAVHESVAVTGELRKNWASGMVNAVLRKYASHAEELFARMSPAQQHSHPIWLFERLQACWPEQWPALIAANNAAPEMVLRINRRRCSREQWMSLARDAGIEASCCAMADEGVRLAAALPVSAIPGFAEGLCSVQDQAAQLAARLLRCRPGHRVLDACAAPGGKTCHLLETVDGIELLALDSSEARLRKAQENLTRLGLQGELKHADARESAAWWDGRRFQRILLDAPCSGSGVIRRHPDIKLLRTAREVEIASALQLQLLRCLWPCLDSDGLLLYCTCSVLREENESVVERFLRLTPDAVELPLDVDWGVRRSHGSQLLPSMGSNDGFYFCLLGRSDRPLAATARA